ncbi:hypothetical protein scyTo_0018331 [Scyliorhinus torazame]|uniref:Uncharacterized protein n=1 Tax=Scyliorhinus torazame TaxID=75743 RepID=A0A401PTB6_SCYTO|nr:hypothetical protein [Scyliorhinus torazame]
MEHHHPSARQHPVGDGLAAVGLRIHVADLGRMGAATDLVLDHHGDSEDQQGDHDDPAHDHSQRAAQKVGVQQVAVRVLLLGAELGTSDDLGGGQLRHGVSVNRQDAQVIIRSRDEVLQDESFARRGDDPERIEERRESATDQNPTRCLC